MIKYMNPRILKLHHLYNIRRRKVSVPTMVTVKLESDLKECLETAHHVMHRFLTLSGENYESQLDLCLAEYDVLENRLYAILFELMESLDS